MNEIAREVVDALVKRATQRGFLMMAEVQQELEDAEAPAAAFDEVFDALRSRDVEIREETPEAVHGIMGAAEEI